MGRQIKFRVWCISGCQFLSQKDLDNFWIRPHDFNSCFMEWLPDWDGETVFEMRETDFIYQQFTGLFDKNNKEIYEGDIVTYQAGEPNKNDGSFYRGKSVVEFENGAFWPRPIKEECEDSWYDYELKDLEVIGNIFENPELLK